MSAARWTNKSALASLHTTTNPCIYNTQISLLVVLFGSESLAELIKFAPVVVTGDDAKTIFLGE